MNESRFARPGRSSMGFGSASGSTNLLMLLGLAACGEEQVAGFVQPSYADPCRFRDCSGRGTCVETASGAPLCECADGFAGADCKGCAAGYHLDARNLCVPDRSCVEQLVNPCGEHGLCDDQSGVVACACDPGYEGARCQLCVPGYRHDDLGQCLQAFLVVDGGVQPVAPTKCTTDYCHKHGQCREQASGLACTCNFGYAGERCDLCAQGYALRAGRCVEQSACEAGACGVCEGFHAAEAFPESTDTCVLDATLALNDLDLLSMDGNGSVWLCAGSATYDIVSSHAALEAGTKQAAKLSFHAPVTELSLDLVARSPGVNRQVKLEVKADGRAVETLDLERMRVVRKSWTFSPPATALTIQSLGMITELVAVDELVYKLAMCR